MGFKKTGSNQWFILFTGCFIAFGLTLLITPLPRFTEAYATLVLSREGAFLNAAVSSDEQWRFEPMDSVPENFSQALLAFEDNYFYAHFGVNPLAIIRAMAQNVAHREIVSGGSTLSMQLARLSRPGKSRNIFQKGLEMLMAIKLELFLSKDEILNLYATHAPFGGNTVGLEAASWRYYQRSPFQLSWAEAATLAVLPNAPSLIYPGKNSGKLLQKRNRLLHLLFDKGKFDQSTLQLALLEPLPGSPDKAPSLAPHLMQRLRFTNGDGSYHTTLSEPLQKRANGIVAGFNEVYRDQGIYNLAAVIVDIKDNSVKAYVGNAPGQQGKHAGDVDIIMSQRSSGSILKPFLFAAAIEEGILMPGMLLPDVPTFFKGFSPQNFNKQYDGLVAANDALIRSLNIPFVLLLQNYGLGPFYNNLRSLGFSSFHKQPEHYGLSMILGGGEVSLWELATAYGSLAGMLNRNGQGFDLVEPGLLVNHASVTNNHVPFINKGSAWITLDILTKLSRPDEESGWHFFSSSKKIAWKTGTSFGFKDAWAVGLTPDYLVAVWVGNANGQGVPGLTGTSKAAPVLFRLFDLLSAGSTFFYEPWENLTYISVCKQSGYLASLDCEETDTIRIPSAANPVDVCPYHKTVHLSSDERFRVNSTCYNPVKMVHKKWFVVPPEFAVHYFKKNSSLKELPPFLPGCVQTKKVSIVYPGWAQKIYLPVDFDGEQNPVVFEAAHEDYNSELRWFRQGEYLGSTRYSHQMALVLPKGEHTITVSDLFGNEASVKIEVLAARK